MQTSASNKQLNPESAIPNLQFSVHLLGSTVKWPVASCGLYRLFPADSPCMQTTKSAIHSLWPLISNMIPEAMAKHTAVLFTLTVTVPK